ncbi:hypothetical protein TNCV_2206931 [Trichonephila clavipes]|uniref:Uncharacterized protein n=1 Tax=Trichonephila clavipes TaxID=2585209 RepID=A0A8X6S9F5_TRICX|nr:hypothetical protein TNCV_2206931 [Trichonephila clavipes]
MPPSPNFHTTPTGVRLSLDRLNVLFAQLVFRGLEPRPYGTAVRVTNRYTGWATNCFMKHGLVNTTRGLLETNLVILNQGQVTRTTPELATLSPNYHTTPMGRRLRLNRLNGHPPYTAGL